jgi:hypothetical protein
MRDTPRQIPPQLWGEAVDFAAANLVNLAKCALALLQDTSNWGRCLGVWGCTTMKLFAFLATALLAVIVLTVPVVGGSGSESQVPTVADSGSASPRIASITAPPEITQIIGPRVAQPISETLSDLAQPQSTVAVAAEHLAQQPVVAPLSDGSDSSGTNDRRAGIGDPSSGCVTAATQSTSGAPGITSAGGVAGTTSDDLTAFAYQYNAIRAANCLPPVSRFVYDSCMETRLFWIAESPSSNPADAWGHIGSVRIDGVPSVGCDGNLAGGSGNTGVTVATKWWDSTSHRAALYRPGTSVSGVCIAFAMTHGGNGDPYSFTRAAARWITC